MRGGTRSLLRAEFFYFDTPDYQADEIFRRHNIMPKFYEEYQSPNSEYVIIRCKISRREIHLFYVCMEELARKMRLCGHPDYESYCQSVIDKIAEGMDVDVFISVGDYERISDQVYNLTLYVKYVQERHPEIFNVMEEIFDGLPGYAPPD